MAKTEVWAFAAILSSSIADAKVQAVASAVWTDEVVAAYAAAVAAAAPEEAPAEESDGE